jgi:hypothetical protein
VIRPLDTDPLPAKIEFLAGIPLVADQATRGGEETEGRRIKDK